MTDYRISNRCCDRCSTHSSGVEYYNMDDPVYFVCRFCEPNAFEKQARQDIDSWLDGNDLI